LSGQPCSHRITTGTVDIEGASAIERRAAIGIVAGAEIREGRYRVLKAGILRNK